MGRRELGKGSSSSCRPSYSERDQTPYHCARLATVSSDFGPLYIPKFESDRPQSPQPISVHLVSPFSNASGEVRFTGAQGGLLGVSSDRLDLRLRAVNVAQPQYSTSGCSSYIQPSSASSATLHQPGSACSTWLHVPGSSTSSASQAESMSPFVRQHREAELRRLVDDLVAPLTLAQWYEQFRTALGCGRVTPDHPLPVLATSHHDTVSPTHALPSSHAGGHIGSSSVATVVCGMNSQTKPSAAVTPTSPQTVAPPPAAGGFKLFRSLIAAPSHVVCELKSTAKNCFRRGEPPRPRQRSSSGSVSIPPKRINTGRGVEPGSARVDSGRVDKPQLPEVDAQLAPTPTTVTTPDVESANRSRRVVFTKHKSIPDFLTALNKYDCQSAVMQSTPTTPVSFVTVPGTPSPRKLDDLHHMPHMSHMSPGLAGGDFTIRPGVGGRAMDPEMRAALHYCRDAEGRTCVHKAILRRQLDILQLLLDFLPPVMMDEADHEGDTPLILAVREEQADTTQALLAKGATLDAANASGLTAAHYAAVSTYPIFTMLKQYGANFNNSQVGDTPLHWAAGDGRLDIVQELVAMGVDLDATNGEGVTPLLAAALAGHQDVVLRLLDSGAQPELAQLPGNRVGTKANSLLHICCDQGMVDCVQRLACSEYGQKHGSEARAGLLPIHQAALDDDQTLVDALRVVSGPLKDSSYQDLQREALELVVQQEVESDDFDC